MADTTKTTAKKTPAKKTSPAKPTAAKKAPAKKTSAKKAPVKKSASKASSPAKAAEAKKVTPIQAAASARDQVSAKVAAAKLTKTQKVEARREVNKVVPAVREELEKNAGEFKTTVTEALDTSSSKRGKLDLVLVAPRTIVSKAFTLGTSSAVFVATTAAKPVKKLLPR